MRVALRQSMVSPERRMWLGLMTPLTRVKSARLDRLPWRPAAVETSSGAAFELRIIRIMPSHRRQERDLKHTHTHTLATTQTHTHHRHTHT